MGNCCGFKNPETTNKSIAKNKDAVDSAATTNDHVTTVNSKIHPCPPEAMNRSVEAKSNMKDIYDLGDKIGEGGFAMVRLCTNKKTN
jgi:hypothetical protein